MLEVDQSGSKILCFVFVIITTTCVGKIFARNSAVDLPSTNTLVNRHSVASFDNDDAGNCGLCRLTFRAVGRITFNYNTTIS